MTARPTRVALSLLAVLALGACEPDGDGPPGAGAPAAPPASAPERTGPMDLGNFCVCLAVKDLAASRAFYEKLGFTQISGDAKQRWLVLRNGVARIGLFQGHLEKNTLTFNPGWSPDAEPLERFTDVRDVQKALDARGVKLDTRTDPAGTGPAYLILKDPDGNPIFIDQHVPRPATR